jgi:hypothetical protein
VTPRRDDDAFSWEGDDDPTLQVDARQDEPVAADDADPVALPEGFTAVGRDADKVGRITPDGAVVMPGDREPLGNAALIGIGILGGVYLLFTIGWVIGGLRLQGTAQFLVSPVIYQFALWLAVLAAPIWFGVTYLLTRRSKSWVRILWLVVGVVLLVPWPFIMTGTVGQ